MIFIIFIIFAVTCYFFQFKNTWHWFRKMRGGIWYKIYDEQTPQWFRFKTEIEASLYEIFP